MKRTFSVMAFMFLSLLLFAKIRGDKEKILGYWMNEEHDIIIYIFEDANNLFQGKIVWLKDSLDEYDNYKRDVMNSNSKLRSRKLIGTNILCDYKYDAGDKEWESGRIYNFENGNTYRSKMWINEEGVLRVRGHWWILWFLSKTKSWTKSIPPELLHAVARRK
ncbi:MAG: DUF2147 domain-containing protein [Chitinophagales bacterium]|nr:DUF2147 domain-containing protein [Chitinophagales bacterium]